MRALYCLPIFVALAACEPDVQVSPATVEWMEWPAEVPTATPFSVRLIVSRTCQQGTFQPGTSADESAVTFEPYWLIERNAGTACLPEARQFDVYYVALDTVGTAPGLATDVARTFEMRAAAALFLPPSGRPGRPVRTYGDVTVRPSNPDGARRNGAGFASKLLDNAGCLRLQPSGTIGPSGTPGSTYVLDDQADTTSFTSAFVRGYIHEAATPVCQQTRVFHLVSRN